MTLPRLCRALLSLAPLLTLWCCDKGPEASTPAPRAAGRDLSAPSAAASPPKEAAAPPARSSAPGTTLDLPPEVARVVAFFTARPVPWRPAVEVSLTALALRGSLFDVDVPVAGVLGSPAGGAGWPVEGLRVSKGAVLATVIADAVVPGALRRPPRRGGGLPDSDRMLHLRSPVTGVLTAVRGHPGARVGAHFMLAQVATTARMRLVLPGTAGGRAELGRDFALRVPIEGRAPLRLGPLDLAPRGEDGGGVTFVVGNASGDLVPGSSLTGWLARGPRRLALVLPASAVAGEGRGRAVFVRTRSGRLERRGVVVGATDGVRLELLGGLRAGETVASSGVPAIERALLARRAARR